MPASLALLLLFSLAATNVQDAAYPGFGTFALAVGDVDGDKLGDVLVLDEMGLEFDEDGWRPGAKRARAWIVSPAAGRAVFDFGDRDFGWPSLRCVALGDVDFDGHADLALVNLGDHARPRIEIWSGRARAVTQRLEFEVSSERALANLGDIDGDGVAELALGVPNSALPGNLAVGAVHIVRASDGVVLTTIWGDGAGTRLGERVVSLGDVNGDGSAEIAVEASTGWRVYCARRGIRWLWSTPLRVHEPCSDANGDGLGDFVGLGLADSPSVWRHVFSGQTGERLQATQLPLDTYKDVQVLGDIDGDGLLDFVCADYKLGISQGQVDVVRGTGALLWSSGLSCHWQYGWTLDVLGDVDGDGQVDLAVTLGDRGSLEERVVCVLDASSGRTIAELRRRGDDVRVWKPAATSAVK